MGGPLTDHLTTKVEDATAYHEFSNMSGLRVQLGLSSGLGFKGILEPLSTGSNSLGSRTIQRFHDRSRVKGSGFSSASLNSG